VFFIAYRSELKLSFAGCCCPISQSCSVSRVVEHLTLSGQIRTSVVVAAKSENQLRDLAMQAHDSEFKNLDDDNINTGIRLAHHPATFLLQGH